MRKSIFSILFIGFTMVYALSAYAQGKWWSDSLCYKVDMSTTIATKGVAPMWLVSNRHGFSTLQDASGYVRAGIYKKATPIKSSKWKIGYGLDIVVPANHATQNYETGKRCNELFVQQMYADFYYKKMLISLGAKERPMEMKHQRLSSGSQVFGINARPVPQVAIDIPEYVSIVGKKNPWLAFKFHFGYGMMTDGYWQKKYVASDERSAYNVLLHTEGFYFQVGNPKKNSLTFEFGLEKATQFGGIVYNPGGRTGRYADKLDLTPGFKDFFKVIIGLGHDETDGIYHNVMGNTVGSWLFSLKYDVRDWSIRAYYDHFFEDHSMMFVQYGWLDGLLGLEINLPKNRFVSTLVYEYMNTTYQGGPIYHDHTPEIMSQISGRDNYYNHNIYPGWQHWGQPMGNPLYTSPLYYDEGRLIFNSNRFTSHHVGIEGAPAKGLNYRVLMSYSTHLGTYVKPYLDRKYATSCMGEVEYDFSHSKRLKNKGYKATVSVGFDEGKQLGNNRGFMFTLSKIGNLVKK